MMEMRKLVRYKDQIEETLNEILLKCNDAKEGYLKAAGMVENQKLKDFLTAKAEERIKLAIELENEILAAGGKVHSTTSIASSIHRVWMEIQNAFTPDARGVLAECLRGENAALDDYSQASIVEGLPGSTRALILRQKEGIRSTIAELNQWHERFQNEMNK